MKKAVIGITFNDKRDQVLVVKRRDAEVWALPGGGVDEGETPEKAITREIEEETRGKVKILRQVAEYTPINRLSLLTYVFECQLVEGELGATNETREAGFYPIDALPGLFFFLHKEWIDEALENKPHVIKKPLNQVTYLRLITFFLKHPLLTLRFACAKLGLPINS